mmetsp:Transcript_102578/g.185011  ORF Transcript_102578/g.185011 Transcript_102578/m.185011 type:complete len:236 (+) Transcript_102578:1300-2007(+)
MRQLLGNQDKECAKGTLEGALGSELLSSAMLGELKEEKPWQRRVVCEHQGFSCKRCSAFATTKTMDELGDSGNQKVGVLVALLQEWISDAPQSCLLGLTVLQCLLFVKSHKTTVRCGLCHLLPRRRIATPEPWHGTPTNQARQLTQHCAALTLHGFLRFFSLVYCRRLLGLLQAASLGDATSASSAGIILRLANDTLRSPAQKECGDLGSSPQLPNGSFPLVAAAGRLGRLGSLP